MDGQQIEKHSGMALGGVLLQSRAQENMSVAKAAWGGPGRPTPTGAGSVSPETQAVDGGQLAKAPVRQYSQSQEVT